jgi:DNA-binding CsgD family transcriptional regulator
VMAARALERSATEASTADLPFERAWNALQAGRMLRRIRERRRAAAALAEAKAGFERLGATPWLARAADELARVGLRRGRPEDLTPTEIAIARLAATGLTTRQVAEAAFVSPKTVEANLTRIYRKLGIGSRAELGATIRQSDGGGGPAQT